MLPAILTTFLFACSALTARRSIACVGSQRANFGRQCIAFVLLAVWARFFGELGGPTFLVFFFSGMLGFGFGDWAYYEAMPRIGPALSMLFCQCLAAPIAAITEWLWLGTRMSSIQIVSSGVILAGVALALAPGKGEPIPIGHRVLGSFFGVLAACGQGWGAVTARFGFQRAHALGFSIDGLSAAYQRLMGGMICIGVLVLAHNLHSRWRGHDEQAIKPDWGRAWPWTSANAVVGAVLGVGSYNWALKLAPSAVVLPIVATSPLCVMLLTFATEGVRPRNRTIVGAVLAVIGVIVLVLNA